MVMCGGVRFQPYAAGLAHIAASIRWAVGCVPAALLTGLAPQATQAPTWLKVLAAYEALLTLKPNGRRVSSSKRVVPCCEVVGRRLGHNGPPRGWRAESSVEQAPCSLGNAGLMLPAAVRPPCVHIGQWQQWQLLEG